MTVQLGQGRERVETMTTITKTQNGYELNENGTVTILNDITKDGKSLILPENESGRKYLALSKFKNGDTLELHAINRNPSAEPRQTNQFKKLYMALELISKYIPQSMYDDITEQIQEDEEKFKVEHIKKPLTEKEKIQKKIEALQKKLDNLTEGN